MAVKRRAAKAKPGTRAVKSAPGKADNPAGATPGGFELDELKQLIRLVQRTGIGELEVTDHGRTVRIAAMPSGMPATVTVPLAAHAEAAPAASPGAGPGAAASAPSAKDTTVAITSPMVGTFYRAPAPDADPYLEVGSTVEVGQTVCIIEAMKLMNEIESEVKGRVVKILIENTQPVEFGQKLFLVEPA